MDIAGVSGSILNIYSLTVNGFSIKSLCNLCFWNQSLLLDNAWMDWYRKHDRKLSYRWQTARRICANQWRGWPPKICPSPCYHAEFGPSAFKSGRRKYRRTAKLRSTGSPLSWDGRLGTKMHTRPHMCYRVKFGSYAAKGVHCTLYT